MFVCAVVASSSSVSDATHARKLGRASIGLSVAGIVLSVITAFLVISLVPLNCRYRHHGSCYNFKTYVGISGSCDDGGVKSLDHYCYLDDCRHYDYDGSCYNYRTYVGPFDTCSGVQSDNYCYLASCPQYSYHSSCYRYKTYVGSWDSCSNGVRSDDGYCYSTSCLNYAHAGSCYKYKRYSTQYDVCTGVRAYSYCYYSCSGYKYLGMCYKYKTYVGSSGSCSNGAKSDDGYCYSTSCRHYEYAGFCYRYRKNVTYYDVCTGVRAYSYCYYSCAGYKYLGKCYKYRTYVGSSGWCHNGVRSYDGYCYSIIMP